MFTFYYHQGGEARKAFVKTVAGIIGEKPQYLRAPTYAYQIGFTTVTKDGNIEVDERTDSELVENLVERLANRGYRPDPVEDTTREPEQAVKEEEAGQSEAPATEAEIEQSEANDGAPETEQSEAPADEDYSMTISVARSIMTDAGIENLKKLIRAKADLLRQAFGIDDTEIVVGEQAVSFPWFERLDPETLQLTTQFISGMCRFANASKRVTSRPRREDNPKFAMRVWMIRMGFSGDEYKALRRYMMRRLTGNAAFRYGRPGAQETPEAETLKVIVDGK